MHQIAIALRSISEQVMVKAPYGRLAVERKLTALSKEISLLLIFWISDILHTWIHVLFILGAKYDNLVQLTPLFCF